MKLEIFDVSNFRPLSEAFIRRKLVLSSSES